MKVAILFVILNMTTMSETREYYPGSMRSCFMDAMTFNDIKNKPGDMMAYCIASPKSNPELAQHGRYVYATNSNYVDYNPRNSRWARQGLQRNH